MTPIFLEHLFIPLGFDPSSARCKLVRHQSDDYDLKRLHPGPHFEWYQQVQSRRVFDGTDFVISFLGEPDNQAVFVGLYEVLAPPRKARPMPPGFPFRQMEHRNCIQYPMRQRMDVSSLVDRLVIGWGRGTRSWVQMFRPGTKPVIELRPKSSESPFPGYLDVNLALNDLQAMIHDRYGWVDWKRRLAAVSAIYMIMDTATGRQYIGSAAGRGGLLARWTDYAKSCHGDNAELRALLVSDPSSRSRLRFSIIEVLPLGMNVIEVRNREQIVKGKFGMGRLGLNRN